MVNLDGFTLTHTYELVDVCDEKEADEFLPKFETENKIDLDNPNNLGFSAGPDTNTEFKYKEHLGILNATKVIHEAEEKFYKIFGRKYTGLIETYETEDADAVIITLGTIYGLVKDTVDDLRAQGKKVGAIRLRYIRPFPNEELATALQNVKAVGVLEKDISFGNEGTVYTNVNSALVKANLHKVTSNYIAGLGGRNIEKEQIVECFEALLNGTHEIKFVGLKED